MQGEALECLETIASLLGASGNAASAMRIQAATLRARERIGLPGASGAEKRRRVRVNQARSMLGETVFDARWASSDALSFDHAIEFALQELVGEPVPAGDPRL